MDEYLNTINKDKNWKSSIFRENDNSEFLEKAQISEKMAILNLLKNLNFLRKWQFWIFWKSSIFGENGNSEIPNGNF